MAEIGGINTAGRFAGGMGLAENGIRPDQMTNPGGSFSRILDEAVRGSSIYSEKAANAIRDNAAGADFTGSEEIHIMPRQTYIDKTDKLYEQCQALETFLVKNILTAMRKNVIKSSLVDTGYAGEIYEDMLWDEYSKEYTKNSGFGLADLAYLELTGQRGRKI
ncbi:MAG: rod-binding protein [Treponema sp.]|nr:rod-binding protein [Treponema sp.]